MPVTLPKAVQHWDLGRLQPYDRNARTHSEEQVAQIVASIQEFGFTNPLLVSGEGEIIAGHGRLMAAQELGLPEVPVIVLDHLTAEQRRAYVIADNQLALNAGWDEELLRAELTDLDELGFDLSLVGFSEDELSSLFSDDEESEDNPYTGKAQAPVYEVNGPKPDTDELYDNTKALELIKKIDEADIPLNEKRFLRAAAYRHVSFSFQDIANYYAHSNAKVQELMEENALVIVDLNKAIENGWARLTEVLNEIYTKEKGES